LELLLEPFARGDQLFITARGHDSKISMWTTASRAAGLYWCAAALSQLCMPAANLMQKSVAVNALTSQQHRTVA
jgi:hypothetical protein